MLHGNLTGLKPADLRRLERLYRRKIPVHEVLSQEAARSITALSSELNRQIGLLVERSGRISHVVVGDARGLFLPELKERVLVTSGPIDARCAAQVFAVASMDPRY